MTEFKTTADAVIRLRAVLAAIDDAMNEADRVRRPTSSAGTVPVRLRAMIAALDEGLHESRGPKGSKLASSIRPDLDVSALLPDVERELAELLDARDELRKQAVIEQRQAFEWGRRRQLSEAEGREDLAAQAAARQAEHQREANTLNTEWDEYSALASEYLELVEALRQRGAR